MVFDPVVYNVPENAGSQLYHLRLLGEIERFVFVTVASEDGTAEGILLLCLYVFSKKYLHE